MAFLSSVLVSFLVNILINNVGEATVKESFLYIRFSLLFLVMVIFILRLNSIPGSIFTEVVLAAYFFAIFCLSIQGQGSVDSRSSFNAFLIYSLLISSVVVFVILVMNENIIQIKPLLFLTISLMVCFLIVGIYFIDSFYGKKELSFISEKFDSGYSIIECDSVELLAETNLHCSLKGSFKLKEGKVSFVYKNSSRSESAVVIEEGGKGFEFFTAKNVKSIRFDFNGVDAEKPYSFLLVKSPYYYSK